MNTEADTAAHITIALLTAQWQLDHDAPSTIHRDGRSVATLSKARLAAALASRAKPLLKALYCAGK
jgi:hypothetical protein